MQSDSSVEPAGLLGLLLGQPVQDAEPVDVLNEFAAHAVNEPPFGPVYPVFATQAVTAVEPVEPPFAELAGQLLQPAADVKIAL